MTYGYDVSRAISAVLGNPKAMGDTYNITCGKAFTWGEVLEVYLDVLEAHLGFRPEVSFLNHESFQAFSRSRYKLLYDRLYDRAFDNKKIDQYVSVDSFANVDDGLKVCMKAFLENPSFKRIDWKREALMDRVTEERTPLHEIPGLKQKWKYLRHRYLYK